MKGFEETRSLFVYYEVLNMKMLLRESKHSDIPFLKQMLYEAVFWRASDNKPSLTEGLKYPGVSNALAGFGERDGDAAVVALIGTTPVGAAWYRYWTDENNTRGYIDESMPVLAIGVHSDYRHQGIGGKMVDWLIGYAATHGVDKISLMVAKDNYAMNLYRQKGFAEYADKGDSLLMVREV